MENYEIVERNLVSKGIRLANYFIDMIVFYLFMLTLGVFIAIIGAESVLDVLDSPLGNLLSMILYALVMFGIEASLGGRSIGKIITGTKVVTEYGEKPTVNEFLTRNFSRLVPFEGFSFFGTLGWHDKWSNTRVVKAKPFDTEILNSNSLNEIGNQM